MSRHNLALTLRQIIEHAEKAQELCKRNTLEQIRTEWQIGFALERVMEVMGEAVKRLPLEMRDKHPQIPWRLLAGMRDRLSHGYDSVDYQILWETGNQDIPKLIPELKKILVALDEP